MSESMEAPVRPWQRRARHRGPKERSALARAQDTASRTSPIVETEFVQLILAHVALNQLTQSFLDHSYASFPKTPAAPKAAALPENVSEMP